MNWPKVKEAGKAAHKEYRYTGSRRLKALVVSTEGSFVHPLPAGPSPWGAAGLPAGRRVGARGGDRGSLGGMPSPAGRRVHARAPFVQANAR